MKTIALANHKGGCAKTTTSFNLSIMLAASGARVLAVDLDPQGNLSTAFDVDLEEIEQTRLTAHRLMLDRTGDVSAYLVHTRPKLDLIPACLDHDAEALLEAVPVSRELLLKTRIAAVSKAYDYCILDTPPALRVPTLNALAMSDLTIIPIESSAFSLVGVTQLMRTIGQVRAAHSPKMSIMALSTMHVARQNLDKGVRERLESRFGSNIFSATIPRTVQISQALAGGQASSEADRFSPATKAYRELVTEIREWLGESVDEQVTAKENKRTS
jgi:chromosome partitioning protein